MTSLDRRPPLTDALPLTVVVPVFHEEASIAATLAGRRAAAARSAAAAGQDAAGVLRASEPADYSRAAAGGAAGGPRTIGEAKRFGVIDDDDQRPTFQSAHLLEEEPQDLHLLQTGRVLLIARRL